MQTLRLLMLGTSLLSMTVGCSHVQDISTLPPYSNQIGVTYRLNREAELWNKSALVPAYDIVIDPYKGYPDEWVVAKLLEGYEIKVEAIKREEGRTLIGNCPYREEYAIVSLEHPKIRKLRIKATTSLGNFENMRKAAD